MRARFFLCSLSACLTGAVATIQACSTGDAASRDAADASDATPQRDPPDAPESGPPCDPKGDLFRLVRDASIGDGASTTGVCLGCTKTKCAEPVAHCTENCPCQLIVSKALECYLTTQQIGCAADLANILVTPETRKYALQVLGCAQTECPAECAVDGGAVPDAGDSGDEDADAG